MFPAAAVRCIHDGGVSTVTGQWPTPLAEIQELGPGIWGEFSFVRRYQSRGRVLRKNAPVKLLIIIFIVHAKSNAGGPDSRGAGVREIIRPVYVIYHDQFPDGFGADWAAFQVLGYTTGNGSPVHYIPSKYGQRPPEMDPGGNGLHTGFVLQPKPRPRWDAHLPGVMLPAGSLAGVIRPWIAGWSGSAVSPRLSGWSAQPGICRPSPALPPCFPGADCQWPPLSPSPRQHHRR